MIHQCLLTLSVILTKGESPLNLLLNNRSMIPVVLYCKQEIFYRSGDQIFNLVEIANNITNSSSINTTILMNIIVDVQFIPMSNSVQNQNS